MRKRWSLQLLLVIPLALAGCRKDEEIKSYDVEHPDRVKLRMLAAIIPYADKTWFVRLSGPDAAVAGQSKAFDALVASIRLDDKKDPPISWTAPSGWKEQPGNGMTFAFFRIDAQPQPLEATITSLGKLGEEGNTLLANLDRWRNQLMLPPVTADEMEQLVRRQKIFGYEVITADLVGMGVPRKASRPMAAHGGGDAPRAQLPAAPRSLPFRFAVPNGWEKQVKPAGMSVVSYEVADGKRFAEITITGLPGGAGGVVGNIVRWRGQVGLPAAKEDEIVRDDIRALPVLDKEAAYVDLAGPKERILGVILPLQGTSWFVKMTGPTDLVGREKANFEAFVKSFRLDRE